jgi:hypothetical protein
VREVSQKSPLGTDLERQRDRFGETEVGWMRRPEECVQHQHLHAAKRALRRGGKRLRIGDVPEWADPVSVHDHRAVIHFDRSDRQRSNRDRFSQLKRVTDGFRLAGAGQWKRVVEHIGKTRLEPLDHVRRRVYRQTAAEVRDGPDVVQAVYVIGVIVSEEERINFSNIRCEKLQPQLGRCVYEKERAVAALDARSYSGSLVPRINRAADLAIASDLRYPEAGSSPKECQLQSVLPPGITRAER